MALKTKFGISWEQQPFSTVIFNMDALGLKQRVTDSSVIQQFQVQPYWRFWWKKAGCHLPSSVDDIKKNIDIEQKNINIEKKNIDIEK